MKAAEFISSLNDLDPDYLIVPEGVDLSGVSILRIERPGSYGYNYPDGVYYNRNYSRFEELVTDEVAE